MTKEVDLVNQKAGGLPEAVFEALHGLMHLYRAQRQRAMDSAGQPLTHMEHKVLAFFTRTFPQPGWRTFIRPSRRAVRSLPAAAATG